MQRLFFLILLAFALTASTETFASGPDVKAATAFSQNAQNATHFLENKGQVKQTDGQPADYVRYVLERGNTKIFLLREGGIAYQFEQHHYPEGYQDLMGKKFLEPGQQARMTELQKEIRLETYRMDMVLQGANPEPQILTEGRSADYINYYNHDALDVHHYQKITYKDVYPGIDWVLYTTTEGFKYDFVVKPGADPSLIRLEFKHHEELALEQDGCLRHGNRLGRFTEKTPVSFQDGKVLKTKFVQEGKVLRFFVAGYDPTKELVIDPARVWGTYYGGSGNEGESYAATDSFGNVYLACATSSTSQIALGGHQSTFGGGSSDHLLVKFSSAGIRQWATYYGGSGLENTVDVATDLAGNVYLAGDTDSPTGIAFGGHQNSFGGGQNDAYFVKFNSAGIRQWASYYGGSGIENGAIETDLAGNIFLSGRTTSTSGIASGGHQNTFGGGTYADAFLAKFNSAGVRQWATYYGGALNDYEGIRPVAVDFAGNVFLSGYTASTSAIATVGSHQSTFGGGPHDAFLVKFNSNGVRQWATYYGGVGNESLGSSATDNQGNVFLSMVTDTSFGLASGGYQNNHGGGLYDALLVKFNGSGFRQWATYFGGEGLDIAYDVETDDLGNVYLAGGTSSNHAIAAGGHQNSFGGGTSDAFLAKFNGLGIRQWATYYGGAGVDRAFSVATDNEWNVYLSGHTNSTTAIAAGGHQNLYGGGQNDAFLAKFPKPRIYGHVWLDLDSDCFLDATEVGFVQGVDFIIQPGNIVTQCFNGYWSVDSLPLGSYTISMDTTNPNWISTCPPVVPFSVVHPDSSVEIDFGMISAYACPTPDISIAMPIIRRGASRNIYVRACNEITATGNLDSAFAIVTLPPQISLQSASLPYTSLGGNQYRFYVGDLNPGQCVNFTILGLVGLQAVTGQTLCLEAELFPQVSCVFDSIPTPYGDSTITPCTLPWDNSSLRVEGSCVNVNNDSIRFVVYNTGDPVDGDMDCWAPVRIYVDGVLTTLDSIRLAGGDSIVFMIAGDGRTWRLEADQHPLHPGNSHPNASVENCGSGTWTPNLINTLPQDDADPVVDIYCGLVMAPLDPNDKTGFPLGVGTQHIIRSGQQMEYLIRFQNTGTDTAFTVIIRDTLDPSLSIFSVTSGVASHPYNFRMYGPRVLEWTFDNIMLPDSNVDEPNSHGFVKFMVDQEPGLPLGTVIHNSAAIYFDFEAPVITNTTEHTLGVFELPTGSENPVTGAMDITVYPNPTTGKVRVLHAGDEAIRITVLDQLGRILQTVESSEASLQLDLSAYPSGIYHLRMEKGGVVSNRKVVKQE